MPSRQLQLVRTGLILGFVGVGLLLLYVIFFLILAYVRLEHGGAKTEQLRNTLFCFFIVAVLLLATGMLFCLAAPRETCGKWSVFVAGPLVLLSCMPEVGFLLDNRFVLKTLADNPKLFFYGKLLSIIGLGFFLFFLQRLSECLESRKCRRIASGARIIAVLVLVVGCGAEIFVPILAANLSPNFEFAYLAVLLGFLGLFLARYGILLNSLIRVTQEFLVEKSLATGTDVRDSSET